MLIDLVKLREAIKAAPGAEDQPTINVSPRWLKQVERELTEARNAKGPSL